jgi:hypothetical protein
MKTQLDDVNKQIAPDKVSGIHFDNESVGDNLNGIVMSMTKLAKEKGLQLSFTRGVRDCTSRVLPGSTKEWDYCLGQTYTNNTADLYTSAPCGHVDLDKAMGVHEWGARDIITTDGFSTPMYCIGGNCQGDARPGKHCPGNGCIPCLDERLNEDGIVEVAKRASSEFPNFGLWSGAYNTATYKPPGCPDRCGKQLE